MPRRDEGRQVVQPVPVEAPDERPDDLAERREPHDGERLQPHGPGLEGDQRRQDERREHTETELASPVDVPVCREHGNDGHDDRHERQEGQAAHRRIFVETAVNGSIEGYTPTARAVDMSRMIWPVAALAVFLLGFVVVYGSVLQARIGAETGRAPEDTGVDPDIA